MIVVHCFLQSKGGKRRRKGKRKGGEQARAKPGYVHVVRENPNYEEYYKKQGIVPEGEWDSFMAILKEDLPATFRITGSKWCVVCCISGYLHSSSLALST